MSFGQLPELISTGGTFSSLALPTARRVSDCSRQKKNCESRRCWSILIISQAIFESFEPESSEEESSEAEGDTEELTSTASRLAINDEEEGDESGTGVLTSQLRHFVIQVSDRTLFAHGISS